jgi:hypothetical protein
MSKSYKRNRIEKLPPEIRYYIAEFIPHKNNVEYPYIPLFKNIILNWYNKYRVYDTATVYRNYREIYENGISQEDPPFMKHAFKHIRTESKYYSIYMNYAVGQFQKIAKRYSH